jgi:hypothetical protein
MAMDNLDGSSGNPQSVSEQGDQFVIGRAVHRRCCETHPQHAILIAGKAGSRSTRHNTDHEGDTAAVLYTFKHQPPRRRLVHLRDNVVAHAPDVALILGDWGMDDQFYAFLTSLWVVFNSNFWAALAGAFGGAVAASKFASRQQKRDDLVRIVNETNAAISISYSACEAYLTHKLILIDDLTNAYHRDFAAYRELQSEGPDRWPSISLNMTEPTLGQVQCSALQDLVFRIPSTTAVIRLVAILNHRNATLHGHMVERNELIRAMRLLDAPDRTALFFGLAKKDGFTDKTYPHLVDSLSELITDCIFFSWLVCELLQAEGIRIRGGRGWLPPIVPASFERQVADGVIPDPENYAGWHNLAPRWRELALPLYKKYSAARQQH